MISTTDFVFYAKRSSLEFPLTSDHNVNLIVKREMSSIQFDVWQVVQESWEWKQQPCASL